MRRLLRKAEFICVLAMLIGSFFIDRAAIEWVGGLRTKALDYFFAWITQLGSVLAVLIIITSLFLWEENRKGWVGVLWLSFITSATLSMLLKFIIGRPRPSLAAFPVMGSSFPSIHAAIAFSTISVLDKEFPRFKWFWVGFSFLVGFSRFYFQLHYPSDVFAGALLGIA
ncbi:hypothetical protein DRJ48_05560, partial [Candidatus Woesearchaeota archaeon]